MVMGGTFSFKLMRHLAALHLQRKTCTLSCPPLPLTGLTSLLGLVSVRDAQYMTSYPLLKMDRGGQALVVAGALPLNLINT